MTAPFDCPPFDCAVIGAGAMGSSTALFLARGGMQVTLLDRGAICRQASGVNAGTLTMQMTRAALIPYALRAWDMWMTAPQWLAGGDVLARSRPGLSIAVTDAEAAMLEERARVRGDAGAPIELITPARARDIEPGLTGAIKLAAHCPIDGFATAHLTGRAFLGALRQAGVEVREYTPAVSIGREDALFRIATPAGVIAARRVVLAGGVWLEPLMAMLGVRLRIKTLINQLIVTEPTAPVMRTVLGIASGLLSLKQFENGAVLIGGGWQGTGDRDAMRLASIPDNLIGNMRLAAFAIPALRDAIVLRSWLGLESETDDALPAIGPLPGVPDAWAIGAVHSGYTSAPFMGRILAQAVLGQEPELPLFGLERLMAEAA